LEIVAVSSTGNCLMDLNIAREGSCRIEGFLAISFIIFQ
jgi:hypothetical protein